MVTKEQMVDFVRRNRDNLERRILRKGMDGLYSWAEVEYQLQRLECMECLELCAMLYTSLDLEIEDVQRVFDHQLVSDGSLFMTH